MSRWRWHLCSARRGYGDLGYRIHGRARQLSFCLDGLVERIKEEGGDTLIDPLRT
jgi:hypothetical protein